jgi:hypothetical protein
MWQITAAPTDREILDPRFELGAGVGFKREEEFVSQSSFASLPRTGPEDPDYWYRGAKFVNSIFGMVWFLYAKSSRRFAGLYGAFTP